MVRPRCRRYSRRTTQSIHLVDTENARDSGCPRNGGVDHGWRRLGAVISDNVAQRVRRARPHAWIVVGHGIDVPLDG